jgi:hypothetical protein
MDEGGASEVEANADADEDSAPALALTAARDTILREIKYGYLPASSCMAWYCG